MRGARQGVMPRLPGGLQGPFALAPPLDARFMADSRPHPRRRRPWLLRQHTFNVTPLGMLARAAVLAAIVVGATLSVGAAIITESALSFLGLGVQPPTPSWGNMLQDSQTTMASKPWLAIFPGLAILITVLCINFIGDGLRDALDPTQRRVRA